MTEEEEKKFLAQEKSFIDRIGWSAFLTIIGMAISIATTFGIAQYRIGEQQTSLTDQQRQLNELKKDNQTDGKSITAVETEIKALNASIGELKDQNKETYRLLLDMSRR